MVTTSVRLDDDITARLDAIAELMSARAAGTRITRSDAVRAAVLRGVDVLEQELAAEPKRKPKPKP